MHPLQGLKRLLLSALVITATTTGAQAAEKFQVITTFTVIADMAKNVAGDAAEVTSITKPGAEIHEYQPTPGDIKRAQKAQLILLDLNMPGMNGLETLDKLRERSLSGRVVVFSVSNHEEDVVTALKRGADGYLLKDMEPEDLLKALQQAAAGEMVLSEALTPVLAASLRANRATSDRDVSQLTPRERDILKLIAQGLPNKMIARRLDITESTVKVHVKHMLKKMKLKSRVEAAVWVHQERIF
jgi:two-component system nitrate/nitrite response regulator NarL